MSQRPSPLPRAHFKHFMDIPTRWNDNDIFGHVNNAVYYQWFDTIVNVWMTRTFGHHHQTAPWIGLVVETRCTYFSEVSYPEVLELGMVCVKQGRSSVTYDIGVFQKGATHASANGVFVQVVVDAKTKRPVSELPEIFARALESLLP
jgi:acyl-CoA thioester hydrolase